MIWLVSKTLSYGLLPNCVKPFNRLWISDFGLRIRACSKIGSRRRGDSVWLPLRHVNLHGFSVTGEANRTRGSSLGAHASSVPCQIQQSHYLSHYPKSAIRNPKSAIRNRQSEIRNRCILAILSAFLLCGLCI